MRTPEQELIVPAALRAAPCTPRTPDAMFNFDFWLRMNESIITSHSGHAILAAQIARVTL